MEKGILIKNVIIITALFVVVFLSQQPNFKWIGKDLYAKGNTYWLKANDWVKTNILPKVSGEVSTIQSSATNEITKQKNNFVQNLWENFKNYFAQKFSKTFGTQVK